MRCARSSKDSNNNNRLMESIETQRNGFTTTVDNTIDNGEHQERASIHIKDFGGAASDHHQQAPPTPTLLECSSSKAANDAESQCSLRPHSKMKSKYESAAETRRKTQPSILMKKRRQKQQLHMRLIGDQQHSREGVVKL